MKKIKDNTIIMNNKEDIIKKIRKSEKEIERDEGIESDMAFKELRKKFGY